MIDRLVTDENRHCFEKVFEARSWRKNEAVRFDDFFLNIAESDLLLATGVVDIPPCVIDEKEELGAKSALDRFIGA